ncbi:hypothetical protein [Pseudomonas sp. PS01297]|uniref:hypothetical protein n=1 Tax=Pseudomonas sp. PS01297 TaxID=2991433 RepID=UPI002499D449|nr:hypothetical protein [Pseudomonas sp. PS01297]
MELKNFFAQDDQGNKLPGATCYLYQRGTESPVLGMLKANGIELVNPFFADKNGLVQLAAPNGLYDIRVVSGARDYRLQLQFNDVTETVEAAEAAALRAETAQDAAVIAVGVKDDVAHGLATTSPGENFQALSPGSDKYVTIYKNKGSGVAEPLASYPNTKAVTDLTDDYQTTIAKGDSNRSLYWGGILSKSGMVGVAFRKTDGHPIFADGRDLLGDVSALRSRIKTVRALRSGVLMGFATPSGRLLGHFDAHTGAWITGGRDALAEIDLVNVRLQAVEGALGNPLADFPIADWAMWGDSLVAPGSSGDWVSKFAASISVNAYNGGQGGEGIRQIAARHGAVPALMTVVGGVIPASGPVAVTTNAYFPASNGRSTLGSLSGVSGTYARSADGLSATFTRTTPGAATPSSANSKFTPLFGAVMRDRNIIFLAGRNSFLYGADPFETIQCMRQMIDYLTPRVKRVMIFEIPPKNTEVIGSNDRKTLDTINTLLKTSFPEYFVDMASWLRTQAAATAAGITFTPQDLTDIANGVTPTSFTSDGLHFTQPCGTAIAYRTQQEAIKRGWIA